MASAALLSLVLSASPPVLVSSFIQSCPSETFAQALGALRPDLAIHTGSAPPGDETIRIIASAAAGAIVLTIADNAGSITREFPDPNDCRAASETAALIIDRALSDVRVTQTAPPIDTLATHFIEVTPSVGIGILQGMVGPAATLALDLQLRWGLGTLAVTGNLFLPSTSTIGDDLGTNTVNGEALALAVGLSPHLGPGHLSFGGAFGLTWTTLAVQSVLPQHNGGTAVEPYVGLRCGYGFNLPWQLVLSVRIEEQLALGRTVFVVEGESVSGVETRLWTLEGTLFVGRRFF